MLKRFVKDENGQDMVEYGLLASFISIVALATIKLIGPLVAVLYDSVIAAMS
jgi:Flp pilus assembly pilin Flp